MWECIVGGCGSVHCGSVNEGMSKVLGGRCGMHSTVILSLRDSSS